MNRLAEILRTGRAPGFNLKTVDPQLPEKAVPRAFKNLEATHSADKIARDARFSVKQIKRIWNMLALLTGLLALPAAEAGDLTKSITFTDGNRLTSAQLHTLVEGATIKTSFLTGKDLLSAVDGTDYVLIYDTSAAVFKRMRLSTLVTANTNLITDQVASGSLSPTDLFLIYDVTRGALGQVSYTNLISGNTNLIGQQPAITNLSSGAVLLVLDSGTNRQILTSDLWLNFRYRAAFTNLSEHTAPTNTDKLLIWDSTGGTNKWTGLSGLFTNLPASVTPGMSSTISLVETGQVKQITLTALNATLATNLTTFTSSDWPMAGYTAATNAINTAHSLGVTPKFVYGVLVCTTAELGYAIGDEVDASGLAYTVVGAEYPMYSQFANATNVGCTLRLSVGDGNAEIRHKTSGVSTAITKANWSLRLYARP